MSNPPIDRVKHKCALCGHLRWDHQAWTLHCPMGIKTRAGFTTFNYSQKYEPINADIEGRSG
jgi:hypothetical protein